MLRLSEFFPPNFTITFSIFGAAASKRQSSNEQDESVIPLLLRNKVPNGYETDDKLDVTLRPDEVSFLTWIQMNDQMTNVDLTMKSLKSQ